MADGLGASTGVFGVVSGVLLRPLDYEKPAELMAVSETIQHYRDVSVSPVVFAAWRAGNSSFSELAGSRSVRRNLATPERPERIDGAIVTKNFFRTLGVSPSLGRAFDDSDRGDATVPSIILDHALWSSRFGADPGLISATIRLDGASHRVVGVMPPSFDLRFPSPQQFWIAGVLDTAPARPGMASYKYHWLKVFGRLRAAALADSATRELEAITARLAVEDPDWHHGWGAHVRPLQTAMTGSVASSVYLIFAAALFLILVGAVNVANLMLARVSARQRELSLRMALGAGRGRVARMLTLEGAVLGLAGGLLGLLFGWSALRWGVAGPLGAIPRTADIQLDIGVVAFGLAAAVLAGCGAALLPAWRFWRSPLEAALREAASRSRGSRRATWVQQTLTAAETTLVFVLLVGATLMLLTLARIDNVDAGFDASSTLAFDMTFSATKYGDPTQPGVIDPARLGMMMRQLESALVAVPGVEAVGFTTGQPLRDSSLYFPSRVEGREPVAANSGPPTLLEGVSANYGEALGMRLLGGRWLLQTDTAAAPPVALVNQAYVAEYLEGLEPIGQQFRYTSGQSLPAITIVGVVSDVRHVNMTQPPSPTMYVPYSQIRLSRSEAAVIVRAAGGDELALTQAVRTAVQRIDPEQAIADVRQLSSDRHASVAGARVRAFLVGFFAVAGLLLGAVGIYGVVGFTASQRIPELGVRMALGADASRIVRLIFRGSVTPVLIGLGFGLVAALGLGRVVASMLYEVSATDVRVFAAVAAIIVGTAVLAIVPTALRTARIDPLTALDAD